ncbi:MAG: TolB family protein [Acidimicrobiia bacterium]
MHNQRIPLASSLPIAIAFCGWLPLAACDDQANGDTAEASTSPQSSLAAATSTPPPTPAVTTGATEPPATSVPATAPATEPEIVFQADGLVRVVGIDGREPRVVARDAGPGQEHPDWSPDGSQLAFDSEFASIWVADAESGAARSVYECVSPCYMIQDPAWSPDGESIAFMAVETTDDTNTSRSAILAVDVESGEVSTLYEDTTGHNWLYSPRWSPDGTSVVFEEYSYASTLLSEEQSTGARIGVFDIDDNAPRYLLEDPDAQGNVDSANPTGVPMARPSCSNETAICG